MCKSVSGQTEGGSTTLNVWQTFTLRAGLGSQKFWSSQGPFRERNSLLVKISAGYTHLTLKVLRGGGEAFYTIFENFRKKYTFLRNNKAALIKQISQFDTALVM